MLCLPSGLCVSRRELLLLLTSTLRSLGCERAVAALSAESGVRGNHARVERLLAYVRAGRWSAARRAVDGLRLRALGREQRLRLHVLLLSAAFMERLERALLRSELPARALHLLQARVVPACSALRRSEEEEGGEGEDDGEEESEQSAAEAQAGPFWASAPATAAVRPSLFSWAVLCDAALSGSRAGRSSFGVVERLSCLLLLSDSKALYERSGWDGAGGRSRRQLAERIADWMPQEAAVAPHRLLELLDIGLQANVSAYAVQQREAADHRATVQQRPHPQRAPVVTSLFQRRHRRRVSHASHTHTRPSRPPRLSALTAATAALLRCALRLSVCMCLCAVQGRFVVVRVCVARAH